jgi:hypothetical protein
MVIVKDTMRRDIFVSDDFMDKCTLALEIEYFGMSSKIMQTDNAVRAEYTNLQRVYIHGND